MAGGFDANTRQKFTRLAAFSYPAGGGLSPVLELPKSGILARIYLSNSVQVGGTVNTPNPLGVASSIRRVKLTTNGSIDIFNVSGAGFSYLLQNALEIEGVNGRQPKNQGTTAVSAATFNLDMVIPVAVNLRDILGGILLQDEQLQLLLSVEWETPTNIGGSTATIPAATATPMLEFFTVPPLQEDWPAFNYVHQILEDQIPVATTGDYIDTPPRGNMYLQLLYGYGINVAAADTWSKAQLRINQNDYLCDFSPQSMDQLVGFRQNLTRGLGQIYFDLLGSDGLGNYLSARDFINTAMLTDMQTLITTTGAATLYRIRRMLMPLRLNTGR
jgi:hypothetical protein